MINVYNFLQNEEARNNDANCNYRRKPSDTPLFCEFKNKKTEITENYGQVRKFAGQFAA